MTTRCQNTLPIVPDIQLTLPLWDSQVHAPITEFLLWNKYISWLATAILITLKLSSIGLGAFALVFFSAVLQHLHPTR